MACGVLCTSPTRRPTDRDASPSNSSGSDGSSLAAGSAGSASSSSTTVPRPRARARPQNGAAGGLGRATSSREPEVPRRVSFSSGEVEVFQFVPVPCVLASTRDPARENLVKLVCNHEGMMRRLGGLFAFLVGPEVRGTMVSAKVVAKGLEPEATALLTSSSTPWVQGRSLLVDYSHEPTEEEVARANLARLVANHDRVMQVFRGCFPFLG